MANQQMSTIESMASWAFEKISEHALEATLALIGASLLVIFRRWWKRRGIRPARDDRVAVLIAALEGDERHQPKRREISAAIKKSLGSAVQIVTWPDPLVVPDGLDVDSSTEMLTTAKSWLRKKNCDVLIWGHVKSETILVLQFATVDQIGEHKSFLLSKEHELPANFSEEIVTALRPYFEAVGKVMQSRDILRPDALEKERDRLHALVMATHPLRNSVTLATELGEVSRRVAMVDATPQNFEATAAAFAQALDHCRAMAMDIQCALATALKDLGDHREQNDDIGGAIDGYQAAVDNFREVLKLAPKKYPEGPSSTHHNLGCALTSLGRVQQSESVLRAAIGAFEEAERLLPPDIDRLERTLQKDDMATAILELGKVTDDVSLIRKAVSLHQKALSEQYFTVHEKPLPYAVTQFHLGEALLALAEREGDTRTAEEAVDAFIGAQRWIGAKRLIKGLEQAEQLVKERRAKA